MSSAAFGEAYTNHAGRAVSGKLTAITNRMAVISGRSYPMSVFPDAEQARMRQALAVPLPLPPALEANRRSLRNRLLRSEALCNAGAKSREDADRRRAEIEAAWSKALDRADLDGTTREHWRARLMAEPATAESKVAPRKSEERSSEGGRRGDARGRNGGNVALTEGQGGGAGGESRPSGQEQGGLGRGVAP